MFVYMTGAHPNKNDERACGIRSYVSFNGCELICIYIQHRQRNGSRRFWRVMLYFKQTLFPLSSIKFEETCKKAAFYLQKTAFVF